MSHLSINQRYVIIESYYKLEDGCIYNSHQTNFWYRLKNVLLGEGHDVEGMDIGELRDIVGEIFDMGNGLMTDSERYYQAHGELYKDYCVPTCDDEEREAKEDERGVNATNAYIKSDMGESL
jgi:hypothetical protein